jgi:type IV pilus assembly protein PilA
MSRSLSAFRRMYGDFRPSDGGGALLRARDERGFTLVEILIVVLIVGTLAGIAIASFLNSRGKGADSDAKAGVKLASQAMETCANDNLGMYDRAGSPCDRAALIAIEPTLSDYGTRLQDPVIASNTYTVQVQSERAPSDVSFSIRRHANGNLDLDCAVGALDKGGCSNPGAPGDDW